MIVVSDAEGLLLWVEGSTKVRSAAADTMNFVEGALWSEAGAGTNAIGTALAPDHPVQVHAAEHFSEIVHGWTCSAAPVHDPETGQLIGVIDLTGWMRTRIPRVSPSPSRPRTPSRRTCEFGCESETHGSAPVS